VHPLILHNDEIRQASELSLSPGQVGLMSGWGVFSTIQVIDGVPFAFERHWERMRRDARVMRVPFPEVPDRMRASLLRLIEANDARRATLRVMIVRNHGGSWEGPGIGRDYELIAFTSDQRDWGAGVKLGVVPDARFAASRFSGVKILSWAHNLVWLEEAHERGLDEVILLNEHAQVSECTSANIFISEGNRIWTPPLSSGCLPGITRELLLGEIRVEGIIIGERELLLEDLAAADEVFITSTTRGLLPVLSVEGVSIRNSGAAREPVQDAFSAYVRSYVARAVQRQSTGLIQ